MLINNKKLPCFELSPPWDGTTGGTLEGDWEFSCRVYRGRDDWRDTGGSLAGDWEFSCRVYMETGVKEEEVDSRLKSNNPYLKGGELAHILVLNPEEGIDSGRSTVTNKPAIGR